MQSRMIWHHIPRYLFLKTFLLCEWILLKCVKHDSYFSLPDETLIEFNFFSCLKKDFTQNIRSQCSLCYHHRVFNGFLNAKIKRSVTNLLFCPFIQNSEIFLQPSTLVLQYILSSSFLKDLRNIIFHASCIHLHIILRDLGYKFYFNA